MRASPWASNSCIEFNYLLRSTLSSIAFKIEALFLLGANWLHSQSTIPSVFTASNQVLPQARLNALTPISPITPSVLLLGTHIRA